MLKLRHKRKSAGHIRNRFTCIYNFIYE